MIRNIIFGDLVKESISHKEVVRQVKKARFCWFFLENEAKVAFDELVNDSVPTVFKPM